VGLAVAVAALEQLGKVSLGVVQAEAGQLKLEILMVVKKVVMEFLLL